jgi:hypothetical protein
MRVELLSTTFSYNSFENTVIQISLNIEVKRSGISNHRQNPREQNAVLIPKEKSNTEMKVKHKRRHKKWILEQSLHKMADRRRNKKTIYKTWKRVWLQ